MFSLLKSSKGLALSKELSFLIIEKRFKHEISKATIFATHTLEDGSKFISRVPETPVKVSVDQLPPPIRPIRVMPPITILSPEQIDEIKRLRLEEPRKWTVSAISKKYNVTCRFVHQYTSPPEEIRLEREKEQDLKWESMGFKRQLIHINRLRRRANW
ncbi:hypothetical protein DSO57_1020610 [Entomophthora muscae]|uniref:Uncharacterized protein n=1 Tax=Entomophthora muscae TaxID=34485 RepID=A0ACC2UP86_9FUNG|nr:hypothetical protein DSO57_1020610 [Entomophthora muscae]